MTKAKQVQRTLENVAAITAGIYENPSFKQDYVKFDESFQGQIGIIQAIIEAAIALVAEEEEWDDWYSVVDEYCELIIAAWRENGDANYRVLAKQARTNAS